MNLFIYPSLQIFYSFLTLIFIVSGTSLALSNSEENEGYEIAKEANLRDEGFQHYTAQQIMTLRNRHGEESSRSMSVKVLEMEEDGDRSLVVFNNPRDVKGTALLTHSHKIKNDEQWLYLPALKRVKRISSSNQSGSFMGSEFAYEDMISREIDKYDYLLIRQEPCGNLSCFVLQSIPISKNSGYKRLIAWIDSEHYRTWKVEYFDRKNEHFKTLKAENFTLYKDKFWRPHKMFMENHLTGKSTLLVWKNYDFDEKVNKNHLTKVGLKRAR
tara:strand:+ start:29694 stop:30506 length:813 start_codon:yes stop_codon:yes gene_type:complete